MTQLFVQVSIQRVPRWTCYHSCSIRSLLGDTMQHSLSTIIEYPSRKGINRIVHFLRSANNDFQFRELRIVTIKNTNFTAIFCIKSLFNFVDRLALPQTPPFFFFLGGLRQAYVNFFRVSLYGSFSLTQIVPHCKVDRPLFRALYQ